VRHGERAIPNNGVVAQAAMIHTGRRAFLSLEGSYHGNSLGGLSIGASDNRDGIRNLRRVRDLCRRYGTLLDILARSI
jgi:hypothetical protein